ncbi:uncharacterized protein MONOS_7344 [Monocercomonoides exilis]|uniref:uncharacterized protein n=1 Tax=Monocercomonoides exilis TaxID=2049356 RepID=UPI003559647D|nr:hypothetical protein MONOS_7344 [Monocercomonoides exilis]|eukprot:MONOS_7344.1-p1 / transcript=MONOS_7344.1 / gene=MONOS_7344 / organism=Monocercomonoides_exilis_PA203 / gene_product=unspecified product / transcript_product=unspecified product / location=Mono_scaffold00249:13012-15286(-) / protein_length=662 / sequence_SO=supercontig / SO=protein_coding / is_pseudo=false
MNRLFLNLSWVFFSWWLTNTLLEKTVNRRVNVAFHFISVVTLTVLHLISLIVSLSTFEEHPSLTYDQDESSPDVLSNATIVNIIMLSIVLLAIIWVLALLIHLFFATPRASRKESIKSGKRNANAGLCKSETQIISTRGLKDMGSDNSELSPLDQRKVEKEKLQKTAFESTSIFYRRIQTLFFIPTVIVFFVYALHIVSMILIVLDKNPYYGEMQLQSNLCSEYSPTSDMSSEQYKSCVAFSFLYLFYSMIMDIMPASAFLLFNAMIDSEISLKVEQFNKLIDQFASISPHSPSAISQSSTSSSKKASSSSSSLHSSLRPPAPNTFFIQHLSSNSPLAQLMMLSSKLGTTPMTLADDGISPFHLATTDIPNINSLTGQGDTSAANSAGRPRMPSAQSDRRRSMGQSQKLYRPSRPRDMRIEHSEIKSLPSHSALSQSKLSTDSHSMAGDASSIATPFTIANNPSSSNNSLFSAKDSSSSYSSSSAHHLKSAHLDRLGSIDEISKDEQIAEDEEDYECEYYQEAYGEEEECERSSEGNNNKRRERENRGSSVSSKIDWRRRSTVHMLEITDKREGVSVADGCGSVYGQSYVGSVIGTYLTDQWNEADEQGIDEGEALLDDEYGDEDYNEGDEMYFEAYEEEDGNGMEQNGKSNNYMYLAELD